MTLECINPATGELITTLPEASSSEIQTKIGTIRQNLESWQSLSLRERARYLSRVQKHLVTKMDDVIDIIRKETGKTYFDGLIEILATSEILRFVRKKGPSILSPEKRSIGLLKTKRGSVQYSPYGVVGVISPWNYPLILTAGPVIEALMAGNGVILKPSEYTPLTALKIKEIFDEADFPKDLIQVVIGEAEVGRQIVNSSKIGLICFIGSVEIGRKIAVACAEQLKPVILELGGKDPVIVLEDANMERAARAVVWGSLHNTGQTCISVERVYVEASVYDQFIEQVTELAMRVRWGQGEKNNDIGCMTTKPQTKKVLSQLSEAQREGAKILVGEEDYTSSTGPYISPTVIVDVNQYMEIMSKETFGPIIALSKVNDAEEALEKANSLNFGLNASIFTNSRSKARKIASRIQSGNVCINDVLANYLCAELPFGGVGASGMGRLHGAEGIRSFTQVKAVCEDRIGLKKEPWWFPVPDIVKKGFRSLIKLRYG